MLDGRVYIVSLSACGVRLCPTATAHAHGVELKAEQRTREALVCVYRSGGQPESSNSTTPLSDTPTPESFVLTPSIVQGRSVNKNDECMTGLLAALMNCMLTVPSQR